MKGGDCMIVKIWPIKASGKTGGKIGIKNSLEYMNDPEKTISEEEYKQREPGPIDDENGITEEEAMEMEINYINNENDLGRVIDYMANEDKTKKSYITGYMCDPNFAVQQFMDVQEEICQMNGRNLKDDTGAAAHHIIQSFPEGMDISDEEVHQCGIELCKKLGVHQAVITSHLRPTEGKDGKLHGKQKHNHILINSYIHPDFFDPEHPNRVKYNPCKESYEQLQIWNDEIALDHGFPIISDPQMDRSYSWYEMEQKNENASWKEQIRKDINNAKQLSTSWEEFKENMQAAGYELKEGKHITYIAPDKLHKARGSTLGQEYTKENLTEFWQLRKEIHESVLNEITDNKAVEQKDNLRVMLQIPDQQVYIKLPLKRKKDFTDPITGKEYKSDAPYNHYFPINNKTVTDRNVLQTYFEPDTTYQLYDQDKYMIGEITGRNIVDFISEKEHLQEPQHKNKSRVENTKQKDINSSSKQEEKKPFKEGPYYSQKNRYNTRTKKNYYVNLYSDSGRRRSTLELMFLLAIVIIKNESHYWNKETNQFKPEYKTNPIYDTKDKKVQNMIDSLHIAREHNISTPAEIEERLQAIGTKIGRTRFQLKKTEKSISKMTTINEAIKSYQAVQPRCEAIWTEKDPAKKEILMTEYSTEIEQYKAAKAKLYKYKITSEKDIAYFINRFNSISEHRESLKDTLKEQSTEYQKLKKLQYHTKLSQDDHYVYGPDYEFDRSVFTRTRSDLNIALDLFETDKNTENKNHDRG